LLRFVCRAVLGLICGSTQLQRHDRRQIDAIGASLVCGYLTALSGMIGRFGHFVSPAFTVDQSLTSFWLAFGYRSRFSKRARFRSSP
jgi:hypothetical protein